MSSVQVRPFRRSDREQLTALVNAHVAAVVPGVSVSVNAVLAHLEQVPGEFIVDPWVAERKTLLAEQRSRVVAAAHLLRYGAEEPVGESYRDVGEIGWFLFWPDAPFWPDATAAADELMRACLAELDRWRVGRRYADGTLPAPGVYGLPEQWPHVRAVYERAGFVHEGRTEIVFLASIDELPRPGAAPLPDLALRRSLGINGTRLAAVRADEVVGYIELETREDAGRFPRHGGLADIGNLHVDEGHRRRGIGTWLLTCAAEWLRLAGVGRLMAYAWLEEEEEIAFLRARGFEELTVTRRGWVLRRRASG